MPNPQLLAAHITIPIALTITVGVQSAELARMRTATPTDPGGPTLRAALWSTPILALLTFLTGIALIADGSTRGPWVSAGVLHGNHRTRVGVAAASTTTSRLGPHRSPWCGPMGSTGNYIGRRISDGRPTAQRRAGFRHCLGGPCHHSPRLLCRVPFHDSRVETIAALISLVAPTSPLARFLNRTRVEQARPERAHAQRTISVQRVIQWAHTFKERS